MFKIRQNSWFENIKIVQALMSRVQCGATDLLTLSLRRLGTWSMVADCWVFCACAVFCVSRYCDERGGGWQLHDHAPPSTTSLALSLFRSLRTMPLTSFTKTGPCAQGCLAWSWVRELSSTSILISISILLLWHYLLRYCLFSWHFCTSLCHAHHFCRARPNFGLKYALAY